VPWIRRLFTGLSPRRPGFDPGLVPVGFVVEKVAQRQVSPRLLRFSSVSFIPPVLRSAQKRKKLNTFIIGLHNKPQGCCVSVASAAGPFTTHTHTQKRILFSYITPRSVRLLFSSLGFCDWNYVSYRFIYMLCRQMYTVLCYLTQFLLLNADQNVSRLYKAHLQGLFCWNYNSYIIGI
jgi:hypothetical protein